MFARTTGKIEDRWRAFMTYQIHRARYALVFLAYALLLSSIDSRSRESVFKEVSRSKSKLFLSIRPLSIFKTCSGTRLLDRHG